jgi:hypothetical protein
MPLPVWCTDLLLILALGCAIILLPQYRPLPMCEAFAQLVDEMSAGRPLSPLALRSLDWHGQLKQAHCAARRLSLRLNVDGLPPRDSTP